MRRIDETVSQAAIVMAVIVLSPYAMLLEDGCGRGGRAGASDAGNPGDGGMTVDTALPPGQAATGIEEGPPADVPSDAGGTAQDAGSPRYECLVPGVEIRRAAACDQGAGYPECRWQIPVPPDAGGLYAIWRLTIPEHRWGSPALVALVLAAARELSLLWPGTPLSIGDLDAPGDRHATHESGVDVDLYLPGLMARENVAKGKHPDNYAGLHQAEVAARRAVVVDLAKVLATCSGGRLRIFYNDPEVIGSFNGWFGSAGMVSPFGEPMQAHNDLHLFHFHVTVAGDLTVLPSEPED